MLEAITERHALLDHIRTWAIEVVRGAPPTSCPNLVGLTGYSGAALWLDHAVLGNPTLRSRFAIQVSERLYNLGIPRNLKLMESPTSAAVLSILAGLVDDEVCANRLLAIVPEAQVPESTADDIVAIALQLSPSSYNQFARGSERLEETGHPRSARAVRTAELVHHMLQLSGGPLFDEALHAQWVISPQTELATFMSALPYRGLRREVARKIGRQCADASGVVVPPPFLRRQTPAAFQHSGFVHFAADWMRSTLHQRHAQGYIDASELATRWCASIPGTMLARYVTGFAESLTSRRSRRRHRTEPPVRGRRRVPRNTLQ